MVITKVMHMMASNSHQIDVHLKQDIPYITKLEKLGNANLVGGTYCLIKTTYEMIKATKRYSKRLMVDKDIIM